MKSSTKSGCRVSRELGAIHMLVVSSLDGVIVEKVGLCRKWLVGRADMFDFKVKGLESARDHCVTIQ